MADGTPTGRSIDLNADLGEGYGPWRMGDDEAMLGIVTSASIACGGHAGDPETMFRTLRLAAARGVSVGAHPGFADREGFGRRRIPMGEGEIERLVAGQVGALLGVAALAGVPVRYCKPHGALANVAAEEPAVAEAILRAVRAVSPRLAILAIAGTALEIAARRLEIEVFQEIYADRGYLAGGGLVPRSREGALIHDPEAAARRLVGFLGSGTMPTVDGPPIALEADSICVHGDGPAAIAMARLVGQRLAQAGVALAPFLAAPAGAPGAA